MAYPYQYQGAGPSSYQPPSAYYPSPPPPQPIAYAPPSVGYPPSQQYDPFRAWYAARLTELTFNSRPIIQELSLTAMQQRDAQHWGNMTAVVEEIEAAVYRSLPHEKLSKLYLIDSISKNVGPPYTTHLLQTIIPRLYIRTYREVDGVTKSKMEEMISLWRRSGPNGGELYGPQVREQVEREIFGSSFNAPPPPSIPIPAASPYNGNAISNNVNNAPVPPVRDLLTRERVIGAIRSTIQIKQSEIAQRPWDKQPQSQLDILILLSETVNTRDIHPQELQQIMDQLRGLGYNPDPSPLPPPQQQQQQQIPFQSSPYPPSSSSSSTPQNYGSYPQISTPVQQNFTPTPTMQSNQSLPTFGGNLQPPPSSAPQMSTPIQQLSTPIPARSTPPPPSALPNLIPQNSTTGSDAVPANILSLLSNLGKLPTVTPITAPTVAVVQERTKSDDYEDMVLSLDLSLRNLDMNRMTELPVDHLPVRCSQCSARFSSTGKPLDDHLDWHVRKNQRERMTSGRGAHRRWLPRGEEWVKDISSLDNATSSSASLAGNLDSSSLAGLIAAGKNMKSQEELEKKWVKVPSGAAANKVCPICKDGFKKEWEPNEEEWVWKNAISVDGKIMHATCRQNQLHLNRLARTVKARSGSAGTKSLSKSKSPQIGSGSTPEPPKPHPLSKSLQSTTALTPKLESPKASPEDKTTIGSPQIKQEPGMETAASMAFNGTVEGKGSADSEGTSKRKAGEEEDEETEEERKRVKVEPTNGPPTEGAETNT